VNNYKELFNLIIKGFLLQGYEIYLQNSFVCTLRRWKLVHKTEDLKVIETDVSIYYDNMDEPTGIIARFSYYNKE
jgi:hypothetical protein